MGRGRNDSWMNTGDHRLLDSLDTDSYRTLVHCEFVHPLRLIHYMTHKPALSHNDKEASPSAYILDNLQCDMVEGKDVCIPLAEVSRKLPHNLGILYLPVDYQLHQ